MGTTSKLEEFGKNSAKVAHLLVKTTQGRVTSWEYEDKKKGQTMRAHKFECILLGETPEVYMLGYVRGSDKQAQEAFKKYKDGNVYKLSQTKLDTWTSAAFISSPKPFRVNMQTSTLIDVPADSIEARSMAAAPVPPRTVAETAGILRNKSCDVIALVKGTANKRETKDGKHVVDVVLIDDSTTTSGERATLPTTVWGDKAKDIKVGETLAFFNLTIKVQGDTRLVNHYADAPLLPPPDCPKTKHLQAAKDTLLGAVNTMHMSSEKGWTPQGSRDVSGPQPLSGAAFLDYTAEEPSANMPSIVQVPWLSIDEPNSDDVVTVEDGSRLWLIAKGRDPSGSVRLGCPQRIALRLAQADDQKHFEEKKGRDL